MRLLLTCLLSTTFLMSCSQSESRPQQAKAPISSDASSDSSSDTYDLAQQYQKFAEVQMAPDTSFLSASEKVVVNKLIEASRIMSDIYLLQLNPDNPSIRKAIKSSDLKDKALILKMFDLHFGVCDTLAQGHVFFGDKACSRGAGFYPADMSQDEFEAWIAEHPEDEAAFRSGYTLIRRDGDKLIAIPYSEAYKPQLEKAAALLREAADLSEEPTLKKFLNLRATSFLTDDYYESEMAWMDLKGNIEIAIGPYEVYDDNLFGYKTAFESFVTIKNPTESATLAKYKKYLRDMEANLPVEETYKNFKRGFESPIAVTYQVQGGGDNTPGVQTIAFNLPNDERVREAKGAKKVILNNVLGAKYDRILAPIAARVLIQEQADITVKKYMSYETLFHELSHSLGPGTIIVDGQETTVNAALKELYTGIEEGKADVMGAYNVLYMMERGELPISEKNSFLATYFAGLFRAMRFGVDAAHGKGAAFQYNYFREVGAVDWLPNEQRFKIHYDKLEQAISDLTAITVRLQASGNYEDAKAFLKKRARLDDPAFIVLNDLSHIPVDIRPVYPKKI